MQNLTAAENNVTAADIPTAVANLTQYSILEQTGISALAQANQQQQLVLKLLQLSGFGEGGGRPPPFELGVVGYEHHTGRRCSARKK